MGDDSKIKIQRWERYVEECRREATLLSPEGQRTMQTVIDSYEKLIAMVGTRKRKKAKALGHAPVPSPGCAQPQRPPTEAAYSSVLPSTLPVTGFT
jgi:hypothetical protein